MSHEQNENRNRYVILPNKDILTMLYNEEKLYCEYSSDNMYRYFMLKKMDGIRYYAELQNDTEIPETELQERVIDVLRARLTQYIKDVLEKEGG